MVSVGITAPMDRAELSGQAASGRLYSIDTAKGIGIFFVVFGHAWRGAFDAGLIRDAGLFKIIDNMIYAWHMPLFFFLSGLLFLDAIARVTPLAFAVGRAWRLMWPLALWTWIFFGIRLLAGQSANHPVSAADFPWIPLPPYDHLWFLWALLLVQLGALPLCRLLQPFMTDRALSILLGALAVALALVLPLLYVPSAYFGAAVEHAPYFLAGIAVGRLAHLRPTPLVAAVAAGLFALILYGTMQAWATVFQSLDLIVLFWVMVAWLDRNAVQPVAALRALRYLGEMSLIIFLAHTIFSAAFRIGLMSVGVTWLPLHLLVGTVVGLAGPILLYLLARRIGLAKWLGV